MRVVYDYVICLLLLPSSISFFFTGLLFVREDEGFFFFQDKEKCWVTWMCEEGVLNSQFLFILITRVLFWVGCHGLI
jgi:hypothetical protein